VQGNIDKTICVTGWTSTVRPPLSYTEPIKKTLIAQLPASLPHTTAAYELDHWVPLELGGDPRSPDNLILQLRVAYGGTAETKDAEENKLHGDVCAHRLSLAQGRAQIMADWPKARFP
jgi:hypothetical protein